jgi:uncharacterized protein YggE
MRSWRHSWKQARFAALAFVALAGAMVASPIGQVGAQNATPPSGAVTGSAPATVSVTGQGRVLVTPDTASVIVGVDIIGETLSGAQSDATTQMTAIIDALKGAGVSEEDIQTSNYSVNILREYDERGAPGPVTGYQISHQVAVIVRDVDQLGTLLDTVVNEGANAIYGIYFYVDDPTAASSQARKMAVEDATTRAQELADAAGLQLGRILNISEGYGPPPSPLAYGKGGAMESAAAAPIQPGSTEIAVEVQVTFELVG